MTWDLSKLYAGFDAPEFLNDVEELKRSADEAVEAARRMEVSVPALEDAIRRSAKIETLAIKTMSFAQLTLAADANCEPAMAAYARLLPILNRLEEASSALSAKLGTAVDLDGMIVYLVDNEHYFGDKIYRGGDAELEQYAFFTRAVLGCDKQGVLYAACGNANIIYVLVNIGGQTYLTRGATYGYYEFVRPLTEQRLTDEAWQEMLEKGKAPGMMKWLQPFILPSGQAKVNERYLYSSGC